MAFLVVAAVTLPLVFSVIGQGTSGNHTPEDTDERPQVRDFVLPTTDGSTVSLAETARSHSAVVLVFHRGLDCSVCRDQIAELAASYTQLSQQGAEVLAISVGTQQDATQIASRTRAGFPVLYDSNGVIISVYGLTTQLESDFTTAIFVVDRDLRLIGVPVGTSGAEVLPVEVILDALRQFNGSDATPS